MTWRWLRCAISGWRINTYYFSLSCPESLSSDTQGLQFSLFLIWPWVWDRDRKRKGQESPRVSLWIHAPWIQHLHSWKSKSHDFQAKVSLNTPWNVGSERNVVNSSIRLDAPIVLMLESWAADGTESCEPPLKPTVFVFWRCKLMVFCRMNTSLHLLQ